MYHLKKTELTSAAKTRGEKPQYYFQRKAKNGRETSRSSETYRRRSGAINGMLSEIDQFEVQVGRGARLEIASGYYDHTCKDYAKQGARWQYFGDKRVEHD
jgi:hypothetical protein